MTEIEREKEIADLGQEIIKLHKEGRKGQAQICFHVMAALIGGRSLGQVEQMEKDGGLNAK